MVIQLIGYGFDPAYFDYRVWFGAVFLFNCISALVLYAVFRITKPSFYQFTRGRIIADASILLVTWISLLLEWSSANNMIGKVHGLWWLAFAILFIIDIVISFVSIHISVCSLLQVYSVIRNGFNKKSRAELYVGISYLLLWNGIIQNIILLAMFGFMTQNLHPLLYNQCGVSITYVDPHSPAASAGLAEGMAMTRLNDHPLVTPEDLLDSLALKKPGDRVQLTAEGNIYPATLAVSPINVTMPFLGIRVQQKFCPR